MTLLLIGAFAELTRVPVKTLRHWAELGVLEPAHTDPSSGYRHYAPDQIPTATTVRLLRALDLPYAEIRTVLGLPDEAADARIEAHLAGLGRKLAEQQRIAAWLRRRRAESAEDAMNHLENVTLADLPETPVISERRTVSISELVPWEMAAFGRLYERGNASGARPQAGCMGIFHEPVNDEQDGQVEAAVPVLDRSRADRVLPAGPAAVVELYGDDACYPQLLAGYEAVAMWATRNGRTAAAPPYEIYHDNGTEDPAKRHFTIVQPLL